MTNTAHSTIFCEAVRANIDHANPTWQGVIECRERTARGTRKLWRKRCGQKMARTTYSDAMMDAIDYANEIIAQNGFVKESSSPGEGAMIYVVRSREV